MSDTQVIFGFAVLLLLILVALRRRGRRTPEPRTGRILVDGSNVMHWGGAASVIVLRRVLDDLVRQGLAPDIYFDANVSYKLVGAYLPPAALASHIGVSPDHVTVVPAGTVADAEILAVAQADGLRIVSNDRYRDWSVQYRWVRDHRRFMRGTWRDGSVVWTRSRSKRAAR